MSASKLALIVVLVAFGAYSAYAVSEFGYVGLWREAFRNSATGQVLFDLCVALALACAWMIKDARAHARTAWPYVVVTLALGSVGPLLYLLLGGRAATAGAPRAHSAASR